MEKILIMHFIKKRRNFEKTEYHTVTITTSTLPSTQWLTLGSQTQQLFVPYREHFQGQPLSKQYLTHCVRPSQAYAVVGVESPPGIHAHSTRALSSSTALLGEWRTLYRGIMGYAMFFHTFYLSDASVFSLTHFVLSLLDNQSGTASLICVIKDVVCLSLSLTVQVFWDCRSASIPGLLFVLHEFTVCVRALAACAHMA